MSSRWQVKLGRVSHLSLTWEGSAPPLHPPLPLPLARWAGLLLQWPTHQITNKYPATTTLQLMYSVNNVKNVFSSEQVFRFQRSGLLLLFPSGDINQMGAQFSSRPAEGVSGWQQWQTQPHTQGTADTHQQPRNNQPEMFQVSGADTTNHA